MPNFPASRGGPQSTDLVQQTVLPMIGNAARDSLDMILSNIDAELAKMLEDRNVLLVGGGTLLFTGGTNTLSMTEALKLEINSRISGGSPVVIDLAATSRLFNTDGAMLYAVINRSAGTATVTAGATSLPAVTSANQEVFLIAKRRDAAGGKRIYFRDGTVLEADKGGNLDNRITASSVTVDSALPLIGTAANDTLMSVLQAVDADVARLYEDRNIFLTQGGTLTFTGTALQFTEALKMEVNSRIAGGAPVVIDLAATTRAFTADGAMLYAVINRTAGTATVTADAATLPAVVDPNVEVFLIAKRRDTGGGLKRLYFRNGMALDEGQSASLGASGSGSGSGNTTLETLKNQFVDSPFELLSPNIFTTDASTKVDGASTGAYSLVSKTFVFSSAAQTLISTQMLDQIEFLADGLDVTEIDLSVFWKSGAVDTAATYQVSRNGGGEYQTVTMSRVGSTEVYNGRLTFAAEASNSSLSSGTPVAGTTALNASSQQKLAQSFSISNTSVVRQIQLNMNKTSSPVGNLFVQIVKDSAGAPSLSDLDVVAESSAVDITSIAAGDSVVTVAMPRTVLAASGATTYHVVLRTDAAYKAGSLTLNWRSTTATGTGARTYNGTAWSSALATTTFGYSVDGYILNLRVKVTSSAGSKELAGYGIFYKKSVNGVNGGAKKIERRSFNSVSDNLSTFTLTQFLPDPDLMTVYWVEGGQAFKWPSFSISGYQVTFPTNTFNNGGISQTITLVFDQTGGAAYDNTDSNANSIATLNNWAGSGFVDDVVLLNKVAAPFTSIVNRAKMVDLSTDLCLRQGVERIPIHQLQPILSESGVGGEQVYKPINDRFDQVRFVGNVVKNNLNQNGSYCSLEAIGDYAEFSFYGTGINILCLNSGSLDGRVTIDGGTEGTTIFAPTASTVQNARNYNANIVINMASGLSLGLHTVKLRNATLAGVYIQGFEVLNESTQIKVVTGSSATKGKKLTLASQHSSAYNSGFTNQYGTAGTKGGHVVVYQKVDGIIGKDVQWTDVNQLTFTNATHSNEEITRNYFWREFGAGRSIDDFSTLTTTTSARAFTLDDGVTTLVSNNARSSNGNALALDSLNFTSAGNFFTFTFVGTGLDIVAVDNANGGTDNYTVAIDGGTANTYVTSGSTSPRVIKIVSGLPYGTHTAKFNAAAVATFGAGMTNFIVYGPKKPAIPSGAVEIGDYNLVADYAISSAGINPKSRGVLSKYGTRELSLVGAGWTNAGINTSNFASGFNTTTGISTNYFEYTFFGTGIEHKGILFASATYNINYTLNGNPPSFYGATTTIVAGNIVGLSFPTSGLLSGTTTGSQQDGAIASISNLPLGKYTLKVVTNNAVSMYADSVEVITPIHVYKNPGSFVVQNTLAIGSQGVGDSRKFGSQLSSIGQATRVIPLQQGSVATSTPTPMGLGAPFYMENDGLVSCAFEMPPQNTLGGQNCPITMKVDGATVEIFITQAPVANTDIPMYLERVVPMTKGWHFVHMFWSAAGGTMSMPNLASGGSEYGNLTLRKVN